MDRQQVIDALIGLMLLLALAVVFVVPFAAIWLVLRGIALGLRHYFPAVSSDLWFYGLVSLAIFGGAIRQLHKRLWERAFLSFAGSTAIFLLGISRLSHRLIGLHDPTFMVAWIACVLSVRGPARFGARTGFFWAAATIGLSFALGSGLLGLSWLSSVVSFGLTVGMLAWIFLGVRDVGPESPWDAALSPASK